MYGHRQLVSKGSPFFYLLLLLLLQDLHTRICHVNGSRIVLLLVYMVVARICLCWKKTV